MFPYLHGYNILTARHRHRAAQQQGYNICSMSVSIRQLSGFLNTPLKRGARAGRDLESEQEQLGMLGARREEVWRVGAGSETEGEVRIKELGPWIASVSKNSTSSSSCQTPEATGSETPWNSLFAFT